MLRVGIVGCGDVFAWHERGWAGVPGVELAGFYDADPAVLARRARDAGEGRAFGDLDELITSSDIVDICTPPESHPAVAAAAIQGGCHLLIEKPVTLRLSDWTDLVSLADERGLKICALHNQKFFLNNQRIKAWLVEGRIGKVLRVTDEYMVTPENEWMLGDETHWSHKLPGGRWLETIPHNLYLLHFLVGPLELAGVSVYGSSGNSPGTPAEVLISLAGDGCFATIHFSARCKLDRRKMTLVGSEGIIEITPPGRAATYSRVCSSTLKKAIGLPFLDAFSKLAQMIPDRTAFAMSRLQPDAHAVNIRKFAMYLQESGENPSPRDEIAYAIRLTESIGRRMAQLSQDNSRAARSGPENQVCQ